ncbi:MAG TPA: hypothetical protein VMV46_14695 [Thermoanaerobaculia bacterium]|nr:hypothetical protein [Thermoanaerobaculia bacterium]
MKFLCVGCDEPMKLHETRGPEDGSVSLVYACPACGQRTAMLTNAHETQVVSSLGVRIGAESGGAANAEAASRCPFTGMLREMEASSVEPPRASEPATPAGVGWTPQARQRLDNIPASIRDMARTGIEKFASDHGYQQVDVDVLERARSFFGV